MEYDRLDLLGVRYDAEMEMKAKYELAKEVYEYWNGNCEEEDFYDNCLMTICEKLGDRGIDYDDVISDETYEIWDIIYKEFLKKDEEKEKETKALEKVFGHVERNSVSIIDINMEEFRSDFDDLWSNEWFTVIDKQWLGENIGREYLNEYKEKVFLDNSRNGYEEEPMIKEIEEITNEIRDEILNYAIEYLDNNAGDLEW